MEIITKERSKFGGRFNAEIWRPYNPDEAKRIRLQFGCESDEYKAIPRYLAGKLDGHNIVTGEGLNALLNIMFHGDTQISTWYCLLFEDDYTPDGDETYDTPGFTESTAYDELTRPEYNEAESTTQSITNTSNKAAFTINDTKTIYGAGIVGGGSTPSTKGDTLGGGTLFCCAKFTASRAVVDDDVINLTYSLSAADDGV